MRDIDILVRRRAQSKEITGHQGVIPCTLRECIRGASTFPVEMLGALQDSTKRKAIDDAREDARLMRIANELADEEERKRQWRVARGEVSACMMTPKARHMIVGPCQLTLCLTGSVICLCEGCRFAVPCETKGNYANQLHQSSWESG